MSKIYTDFKCLTVTYQFSVNGSAFPSAILGVLPARIRVYYSCPTAREQLHSTSDGATIQIGYIETGVSIPASVTDAFQLDDKISHYVVNEPYLLNSLYTDPITITQSSNIIMTTSNEPMTAGLLQIDIFYVHY